MGFNRQCSFNSIPALSILFFILKYFFPGTDPYLKKGAVILAEVDDIIDGVLLKLPDNRYLNTINDIIDQVLKELEEAGYKVNDQDKKKLSYHIMGKVKNEKGLNVKWEDGKLKLGYNRKF
ncbi:MAG: hypothetical protein MJA82_05840 [Clostridia bacterium]|nr:hypothetical protein [Clostridia bacterium]